MAIGSGDVRGASWELSYQSPNICFRKKVNGFFKDISLTNILETFYGEKNVTNFFEIFFIFSIEVV